MAAMIWSIVACIGAVILLFGLFYVVATGNKEREQEDAARDFFSEHGRWPDEELPPVRG